MILGESEKTMKTQTFIKEVEQLGFYTLTDGKDIYIFDREISEEELYYEDDTYAIASIGTDEYKDFVIKGEFIDKDTDVNKIYNLFKLIMEYTNTPIEERNVWYRLKRLWNNRGGIMQRLETIFTISEEIKDIEFTCPYCEANVSEDLKVFLEEQGLSWSDFPDWEYEPIKCPFCENEIEVSYEFDWG